MDAFAAERALGRHTQRVLSPQRGVSASAHAGGLNHGGHVVQLFRNAIRSSAWVAGATLVITVGALGAQPSADSTQATSSSQRSHRFCWRGRPLARCRAFGLFELSAPRHLAGSMLDPAVTQRGSGYRRWDQGLVSQFVYDIGAMVNVRAREAIGGTLTAGVIVDDPEMRPVIGATVRYRRWLTSTVSADAAAGVLRMPVGVTVVRPFGLERQSVPRPAVMADVRLGFADLVAVTGRAMVATDGRGRTHQAVFVGVSVGSTVAAVVTGAFAALTGYMMLVVGKGDVVTLAVPAR